MKAIMRDKAELRDSGIEWIGQFPLDWKVMTIKYTSWLKGRIGWQGLKSTEFVDNGPYLITGTDFKNGIVNWETCAHITDDRFIEDEDIHIIEDDLLITKDGTIGKVAIAKNCPEKVSLNSGVLLIRNDKIKYIDKYLYYTLLSEEFILWYELNQPQNSTIRHLYQGQFYNFKFAFPPYDEQQAIANYLDDRCSKIDTIIAEAKASIEEYKELKQAVIYEAVTKGLDKNVEMMDSGIKWVGLIPAHWEYKKLRYSINNIGDIDHYMPESVTNGIPYIMTGDLKSRISEIDFDKCKQVARTDYEKLSAKIKAEKGDIIFARYATIGSLCYVDIDADFLVSYSCVIIKPNPKVIESHFLEYYLQSNSFIEESKRYANANVQANVGKESMYQAKIALPPLKEQQDIVRFLDIQTCSLDSLISEKLSLIEDLESYKKSLIYEVVTGKRKVVE